MTTKTVDHFVMWNSQGSVIHIDEECHHIPRRFDRAEGAWMLNASMGRAMTIVEAAAALDLPLCPCAADTVSLRDAAVKVSDFYGPERGELVDNLTPHDFGCLICRQPWVPDAHGATLDHGRMCIVPVVTWMPNDDD